MTDFFMLWSAGLLESPQVMGYAAAHTALMAVCLQLFVVGIGVWLMFFPQLTNWGEAFPGQLAGLLAALSGMVAGSLGPQLMRNKHAVHELAGLKT